MECQNSWLQSVTQHLAACGDTASSLPPLVYEGELSEETLCRVATALRCGKGDVALPQQHGVLLQEARHLAADCDCCSGRMPRALLNGTHTWYITVCGATAKLWIACSCQMELGGACNAVVPDVVQVRVCDTQHPAFSEQDDTNQPGSVSARFRVALATANRIAVQAPQLHPPSLFCPSNTVLLEDALNPVQVDCDHPAHHPENR